MWADVWEAALQETDAFSGKYEHSCYTHTHTSLAPLITIARELSTPSALSMLPF